MSAFDIKGEIYDGLKDLFKDMYDKEKARHKGTSL